MNRYRVFLVPKWMKIAIDVGIVIAVTSVVVELAILVEVLWGR